MAVSIAVMLSLATTFTTVDTCCCYIAVFISGEFHHSFHYADEFRRNFRDMGKKMQ